MGLLAPEAEGEVGAVAEGVLLRKPSSFAMASARTAGSTGSYFSFGSLEPCALVLAAALALELAGEISDMRELGPNGLRLGDRVFFVVTPFGGGIDMVSVSRVCRV